MLLYSNNILQKYKYINLLNKYQFMLCFDNIVYIFSKKHRNDPMPLPKICFFLAKYFYLTYLSFARRAFKNSKVLNTEEILICSCGV